MPWLYKLAVKSALKIGANDDLPLQKNLSTNADLCRISVNPAVCASRFNNNQIRAVGYKSSCVVA